MKTILFYDHEKKYLHHLEELENQVKNLATPHNEEFNIVYFTRLNDILTIAASEELNNAEIAGLVYVNHQNTTSRIDTNILKIRQNKNIPSDKLPAMIIAEHAAGGGEANTHWVPHTEDTRILASSILHYIEPEKYPLPEEVSAAKRKIIPRLPTFVENAQASVASTAIERS